MHGQIGKQVRVVCHLGMLSWQLVICLCSPVKQAPALPSLVPSAALEVPVKVGDKMPGGRPCTAASAPTPAEKESNKHIGGKD